MGYTTAVHFGCPSLSHAAQTSALVTRSRTSRFVRKRSPPSFSNLVSDFHPRPAKAGGVCARKERTAQTPASGPNREGKSRCLSAWKHLHNARRCDVELRHLHKQSKALIDPDKFCVKVPVTPGMIQYSCSNGISSSKIGPRVNGLMDQTSMSGASRHVRCCSARARSRK